VTSLCRRYAVTPAGFYAWRCRGESAHAEQDRRLSAEIARLFTEHHERYGSPRIHRLLHGAGWVVSRRRVARLMRAARLRAKAVRGYRSKAKTLRLYARHPDRLRGLAVARPNQVWVGDLTYVPTDEGWLYLATVIDCHTKEVIGWATANHMRAELVCDALRMAARNYPLEKDCIFHSDRGVQYTSDEYRRLLRDLRMRPSVGRTGVCWDNAMAESFFASLKKELVHRTTFATRREARDAIANYIEIFYNRRRLHSGIGYRTPCQVYWHYQLAQAS
jgi:putative transposase